MMPSQSVPMEVRDPKKPPRGLTGKSKRNWIHNATKELQNYNYRRQFPLFHIPSTYYNICHIHRFMQLDTMDMILTHFQACHSFTIDTEAVRCPSNLALIQIQSIPVKLPSYVLLVQLRHLPNTDSLLFKKIRSLFTIIFDKCKTIYSWGPLDKEIQHATPYSLLSLPIQAKAIDLQLKFSEWYCLVRPSCEKCKPNNNTHITVGSSMFCGCREHAYNEPSNPWSLQNAVLYATTCFLDKSQTENNWFNMLDPEYTRLSSDDLHNMINYAIYDCLSVTYLRLPALQRWSLVQLEKTPLHILLTDSKNIISDPDLEYVSEDELPQVIQPSLLYNHQQQEKNEVKIDEVGEPQLLMEFSSTFNQNLSALKTKALKSHSQRSVEARARRNKKRNTVRRKRRYKYPLTRSLYYRFRMNMIRKIVRQLIIPFPHIKRDGNQLIIGMKNERVKEKFQQLLPVDLFDRDHYYSL